MQLRKLSEIATPAKRDEVKGGQGPDSFLSCWHDEAVPDALDAARLNLVLAVVDGYLLSLHNLPHLLKSLESFG